jgi:hypothetical protein
VISSLWAPAAGDPAWLRIIKNLGLTYVERFDWPISIDLAERRLFLTTNTAVEAITMPANLGRRVLADRRNSQHRCPVIGSPVGQWWTFLTEPPLRNRAVPVNLQRLRVRVIPFGGQVILPHGTKTWTWIEEPVVDRPLPAWWSIMAAAQRVVRDDPSIAPELTGESDDPHG